MPKVSEAFDSNLFKATDLGKEDRVMTITSAEMEEIGRGKDMETKIVLEFKGQKKKLALNKTNAKSIAKLHGDDTDDWVGKKITLYATETEFNGDTVACIRVRTKAATEKAAPKGKPATEVEVGDDWQP